jgi:hypothetical protein
MSLADFERVPLLFGSAPVHRLERLGEHLEVELVPLSRRCLADEGTFTARKDVELLREFAAEGARAG